MMKRLAILLIASAVLSVQSIGAYAQVVLPAPTAPPPLAPAAPPPPSLSVPQVPRMDAPAPPPQAPPQRQSFNRRVRQCIDEAATFSIDAGDRAGYARACSLQ